MCNILFESFTFWKFGLHSGSFHSDQNLNMIRIKIPFDSDQNLNMFWIKIPFDSDQVQIITRIMCLKKILLFIVSKLIRINFPSWFESNHKNSIFNHSFKCLFLLIPLRRVGKLRFFHRDKNSDFCPLILVCSTLHHSSLFFTKHQSLI